MGLAASLAKYRTKATATLDAIVRQTSIDFAESLVKEWTPYGDPTLWKSPPPVDYRPGNLQSSWFLSIDAPSSERTEATTHRTIHHLDQLPEHAGHKVYFSNSAPHASSIEGGHSSQAPVGIMWAASEFSPMAAAIARRLA